MTHQHLDLISIYGTWSDVGGDQFLVQTHPSGIHCTVLDLCGSDYGGGVSAVYEISDVKTLDKILATQDSLNPYTFKRNVMDWCKSQISNSLTI